MSGIDKHEGIYSSIIKLLFPGIYFVTVLAKRNFFHSYFVQYFATKDTSQLKMLYGYPEGKNCQYLSQRSLCCEAKKKQQQQQRTEI